MIVFHANMMEMLALAVLVALGLAIGVGYLFDRVRRRFTRKEKP